MYCTATDDDDDDDDDDGDGDGDDDAVFCSAVTPCYCSLLGALIRTVKKLPPSRRESL